MNSLFNEEEIFSQTPTQFLKEIKTEQPINLNDLTGHTDVKDSFTSTGQPTPPNGIIPPSTPGGGQPQNMTVGSIVSADMAAQLFNIILPAVMVIVIQRATNKKVVKQQFEATAKEIEVIKPVLQNYLNSVNFTVESPFNALILTVGIIYGSKAIEALNGQAKGSISTKEFTPPPVENIRSAKTTKTGQPRKARPSGMTYNKNKF